MRKITDKVKGKMKDAGSYLQKGTAKAGEVLKIGGQKYIVIWKKHRVLTTTVTLIALLLVFNIVRAVFPRQQKETAEKVYAQTREIVQTVTGKAVLLPAEEYQITIPVSGDILKADFEEGDVVSAGDVLYEVDAGDMDKSIESAELAVSKADEAYVQAVKAKALSDTTGGQSVDSANLAVKKAVANYDAAVKERNNTKENAGEGVTKAEIALAQARQDYQDALRKGEEIRITPDISGVVTELSVKTGDVVNAGMTVGKVSNDRYMKVVLPFHETDPVEKGDSAEVTVTSTGDVLWGEVTEVSSGAYIVEGHNRVHSVTIWVENPGALSEEDTAVAIVGGAACSDMGKFTYAEEQKLTAHTSGTVYAVNAVDGDWVEAGAEVVSLKGEDASSQIAKAKGALDSAESALRQARLTAQSPSADNSVNTASLNVEDAKLALAKAVAANDDYSKDSQIKTAQWNLEDAKLTLAKLKEQREDYTVTAPISGTVVTKNLKVGDNSMTGSSSSTAAAGKSGGASAAGLSASSGAAAVIYDMSGIKFVLDVDELDIKKIKKGMEVTVTADAADKPYQGTVDQVSLKGKANDSGVTTYPVTIVVENDDDGLLPGMNIEAEIVTAKAEGVLAIPVDALNRGDVVYVKGKSRIENDQAPEGYGSVTVETGINDENYVEIKSGLSEGEEVYVEGVRALSDMEQMQKMQQQGMRQMGG